MKSYNGHKKKRFNTFRKYQHTAIESRDFSVVEDKPEFFSILKQLGAKAAINAAAEAKAAGLSHTFARGQNIVRLHADGREEIISSANDEKIKGGSYYIHYTPSFLHVSGK